ncbi:MAG: murein biosynthesis integral membrane protein MurJ [Deltaproteobacteria bacterium]|jgi:putative peptidoglycan lipid II flippase|nr:murein biosynthesis integral membrane protein MurJ [Deltaproteobacteria bacterium]
MKKSISVTRAASIVGIFTLLSRIFGLIRDIVFAAFIDKFYTDVFFIAFTIPNVFRRLLAEGTLTISFIPVFTDYRKKGKQESLNFVTAAFTVTAILVAVFSLLGILLSPVLALLFAGGFEGYKFQLVINMTRIMFPYILFVSLMALSMGVLNTLGHFVMPAAAPVFLNLCLILSAVAGPFLGNYFGLNPIYILAWGVIAGGILQFIIQIPAMKSRGYPLKFNPDFKHPGIKKILRLMGPALFGLAIYQITVMLSRQLASFLGTGAVSYLYYSQRLIEFPMGVFAVAIATGSMPTLSRHASDKKLVEMKKVLRNSLELAQFVILPSMLGLSIIAIPIVAIFFQRGEFDYAMTRNTAYALIAFSFGLPAMATVRNVVNAFYALKDSKTPVFASAIALVVYLVFGLSLMWIWGHIGLALAITISAWSNAGVLLYKLRKKIGLLGLKKSLGVYVKILLSSFLTGISAYLITLYGNWENGGNNLRNILVLFVALGVAFAVYVGMTSILGLEHFTKIYKRLKARLSPKK